MNNLSIPENHLETIQFYIGLPAEIKSKIQAILMNSEIGILPGALVKRISQETEISDNKADEIISVIVSLLSTKNKFNLEGDDFLNSISKSISTYEDLIYNAEDVARELLDLTNLIGNNTLITVRAVNTINENQKVYLDSSVTSDLRPVFLNNKISGFVVVNNFRIEYRENDKVREMFLSLDSQDLKELSQTIEQAEKNIAELRDLDINIIDFV